MGRIAQIHADLAKAASEDLTLKQRYQMAAETMKRQLHALRLTLKSAPRMTSMPFDTLAVNPPSSPYSPRSRQMSITAPVFTPSLVSESNSDNTSMNTSDSEEGFNMDILVVGSDSEDSQVSGQSEQLASRRELLGKTISGRLNVYTPKNGTIRYYINWSKNTHDNILVTPEAMETTFGSPLKSSKLVCIYRLPSRKYPPTPRSTHPELTCRLFLPLSPRSGDVSEDRNGPERLLRQTSKCVSA